MQNVIFSFIAMACKANKSKKCHPYRCNYIIHFKELSDIQGVKLENYDVAKHF